ncbi:hypothetical protein ASU2_02800 [Actinobacillus suis H91-0380]|uniref:Uncharacterized protein n=1 Tax=Actinobacillus suis H91-0380 TaxID=696748 RepID=K0FWC6_ACTSU|nr:hypothetical protein [Actinobacillus suis]AFU18702.1 hypothetical protein ASU2_02800 [Actinobacillus suis H91-0380]
MTKFKMIWNKIKQFFLKLFKKKDADMYGLQLGKKEIKVFSDPISNSHGLSNGNNELNLDKLYKLTSTNKITKDDSNFRRLVDNKSYDDWYGFNDNTNMIDEGVYATFSNIENLVQPVFVKPFTNAQYGLQIKKRSIGEHDHILRTVKCTVTSTIIKSGLSYLQLNFAVAGKYFNLHQVLSAVVQQLGDERQISVGNGHLLVSGYDHEKTNCHLRLII